MTAFRLLCVVLAIAFAGLLVWAQMTDDLSLGEALSEMFNAPWTITAIADLYIGFFLAATLIVIAEKKLWVGLMWGLPIFVLGNVITLLWFAVRLPRLVKSLRNI